MYKTKQLSKLSRSLNCVVCMFNKLVINEYHKNIISYVNLYNIVNRMY